jgi:hypothetical protein
MSTATAEYPGQPRHSRLSAPVVVIATLVTIAVTAVVVLALHTHTNASAHPTARTISQLQAATKVAPQFAGTFINEAMAGAPIGIGPGAGGGPRLAGVPAMVATYSGDIDRMK